MPLSKETKDRIATQAIREYPANQYMSADLFFKRQGQQESYVAGAEAEAERAAGLVEASIELDKQLDALWKYDFNDLNKELYDALKKWVSDAQKKCAEALTKYNNSK